MPDTLPHAMGDDLVTFARRLAASHREGADCSPAPPALVAAARAGQIVEIRRFLAAYSGDSVEAPAAAHSAAASTSPVPGAGRARDQTDRAPEPALRPQVQLASYQRVQSGPAGAPAPAASPVPATAAVPALRAPTVALGTEEIDRQALLGVAKPPLPFSVPSPRKENETVMLGHLVKGEVSSGTVMLREQAVPAMAVPFTLAPARNAAESAALPFLPLDTFAETVVAMMEGGDPLPIFAALGLHPAQYLQLSGAFYDRAGKDASFKAELDRAIERAKGRRR